MADYKSFAGTVSFVDEIQKLPGALSVKLSLLNSENDARVAVTIFPELREALGMEPQQGDFMFVEGKYQFNDPYHNLTASRAGIMRPVRAEQKDGRAGGGERPKVRF